MSVSYLRPLVPTIRRILQRPSQRALRIPPPQQLTDLGREALHIRSGDVCDGRSKRGDVEVGGGFGVEEVDIYGPPVYFGCHCLG